MATSGYVDSIIPISTWQDNDTDYTVFVHMEDRRSTGQPSDIDVYIKLKRGHASARQITNTLSSNWWTINEAIIASIRPYVNEPAQLAQCSMWQATRGTLAEIQHLGKRSFDLMGRNKNYPSREAPRYAKMITWLRENSVNIEGVTAKSNLIRCEYVVPVLQEQGAGSVYTRYDSCPPPKWEFR
jgi:hypothetical protein